MSRLDEYRTAMLAANADVSAETLNLDLDESGPEFVSFIVDHGLGPLWHTRTGRDEFHESRLTAEALYLAQENGLNGIHTTLDRAGVDFVVIKGAANRLFLYENPAVRACFDIDLLVRPEDRLRAASCLVEAGFTAAPEARSISRELVLTRGMVDVDLHWGLLREGRLRADGKELDPEVQAAVGALWDQINTDTLRELSDFAGYKREFLQLFGFEIDGVDYDADVNPQVVIENMA